MNPVAKPVSKGVARPVHTGQCHNCQAPISGNYCAACGQETKLHVASAREFLHEFIGHHMAFEGRLWTTMGLLLFRPGQLTAAYIAGRRVRYVQPLRLYLTLSFLFFLLLKYGAFGQPAVHGEQAAQVPSRLPSGSVLAVGRPLATLDEHGQWQALPAASHGKDGKQGAGDNGSGSAAGQAAAAADAGPAEPDVFARWFASHKDKINAFMNMSNDGKIEAGRAAFINYVPYAMFCMLPMFALYLKLLYLGSGRRYGEHLLFALHTNAFAFVMFGYAVAAPSGGIWTALGLLVFAWLTLYLPMAMRVVYGGRRLTTFLRWLALMAAHLLTLVVAIALALLFPLLA